MSVKDEARSLREEALALRNSMRGLRRRRVAFVFSGGGNLGAVQVGMVKALLDEGIEPDLVVGSSVGAINAAALAAEPGRHGLKRLERMWGRMADGRPEIMPHSFLPVAVEMARKGQALHDPAPLHQLLNEELLCDTVEELQMPFACVATDLETSDEHWFEAGPLIPALLASSALPAVFPPVEIDGRRYIDGGVVREAPVAKALEMGATDIYFFHPGHLGGRRFEAKRPFDAAIHAYWTLRYRRMLDDLDEVAGECELIVLPTGVKPRLRFDDFSKGRELMSLSYDASLHFLRTGETVEPVELWSGRGRDDDEREPDGSDGLTLG
ncbi:MAG: patatin-like phospholipase family protein [Acidimicrobiales bacterium]